MNRRLLEDFGIKYKILVFKKKNLHERNLAAGYPHCAHCDFWMWYEDLPHLRHKVCVLLRRLPKLDVPFVCKKNKLN